MPRIARIDTLDDVRRHLTRVYTRVKSQNTTVKLNASAGKTCIAALNSIARILKDNDLGGRLAALEEALAKAGLAVPERKAAVVEPPESEDEAGE